VIDSFVGVEYALLTIYQANCALSFNHAVAKMGLEIQQFALQHGTIDEDRPVEYLETMGVSLAERAGRSRSM